MAPAALLLLLLLGAVAGLSPRGGLLRPFFQQRSFGFLRTTRVREEVTTVLTSIKSPLPSILTTIREAPPPAGRFKLSMDDHTAGGTTTWYDTGPQASLATPAFEELEAELAKPEPAQPEAAKTASAARYPAAPTLRECFAFAIPALGIYVASPLMSLIDAAFVGRQSSLELAALGPASSISDSAPLPLLFLSIGATNLAARAFLSGDEDRVGATARCSVRCCDSATASDLAAAATRPPL